VHDIQAVKSRVDWTIADGDPMWGGNLDQYAGVGESALCCIRAAQMFAGVVEPISVLDFGCAHGRVTRWLRAAWPNADLHVADVVPEWVAATSKANSATG
jgi:trans-aconitate methyltransferase